MKETEKPKKKKLPLTATPVARITSMLRKIWTWSPERAAVMKRSGGYCEECGLPGSKTKKQQIKNGGKRLEVHHCAPCDMTELAKLIHKRMFPGAELLTAVCEECHVEMDEQVKRLEK